MAALPENPHHCLHDILLIVDLYNHPSSTRTQKLSIFVKCMGQGVLRFCYAFFD